MEEIKLKDNSVILFDNDDEFTDFCIVPVAIAREYVNPQGNKDMYADFNMSNAYNDAIANGTLFVIKDPNSLIAKRDGIVTYRTMSHKVDNLMPWYFEDVYRKQYECLNEEK